jgi:hypothetical protein
MNPFDYVNSITSSKTPMMNGDPLEERDYNPYLTNRSLSNFADTVFLANAMNTNNHLDKRMQYDYLFYSATKKKRYSKWHKPEQSNQLEVDAIKAIFGYSEARARQTLKILKPQDVEKILKEWQHMNGK